MNTKHSSTRRAALAVLVSGFVALAAVPSLAADAKSLVDAAKERGEVGEQADGFLGFVQPVSDPQLQSAVGEINAGRAEAYRETAARTGVDAAAAGQATAVQLLARMPAGHYHRPLGGAWTRK